MKVFALLFLTIAVVTAHHHNTPPNLPKEILYEDRGAFDAHPAPIPEEDISKLVKITKIDKTGAAIAGQPLLRAVRGASATNFRSAGAAESYDDAAAPADETGEVPV